MHVGVVLFAVAFSLSSTFSDRREARLEPGETVNFGGFDLTYLGTATERSARKVTTSAKVRVERQGQSLGVYTPALSQYPSMAQAIGTPSVRTGITRDLYLTLVAAPRTAGGPAVVGIQVNPLVVWLWIGGGVMAAGTAFAALPDRRRAGQRVAPHPRLHELAPTQASPAHQEVPVP